MSNHQYANERAIPLLGRVALPSLRMLCEESNI